MDYQFLWPPVIRALPDLIAASSLTLQVSVIAMVIGLALGLLLAFARMSDSWLLRAPATVWVEVARNTPLLFQLFFFYWGLGEFGIFLSSYVAVVAGLSFNTAGYMAETFRGGIAAVPATQLRSARSLGLSAWQAQTRVVLPQVLRAVYYPMTNQFVWVVLMSSLGMLAGLRELAGETQFYSSRTFRTFEFFVAAALLYYLIIKVIVVVAALLARPLFKSDRLQEAKP